LAAAAILAVAVWGPPLAVYLLSGEARISPTVVGIVQGTIVAALVWLAAGALGGDRRKVLCLQPAKRGARDHVPTISVALTFMFVASFAARWLLGSAPQLAPDQDSADLIKQALLLLVVAPVSEELLFRGFLLSVLHKTKLGFWGASCLLSAAWSTLHVDYPPHALVTLFLLGLTLSWVIWRTGSLWTGIILHSLFNAYYVLLSWALVAKSSI
jgi:membrane protease YdiL (CAAX protease family)